jgi:hypothetical protein
MRLVLYQRRQFPTDLLLQDADEYLLSPLVWIAGCDAQEGEIVADQEGSTYDRRGPSGAGLLRELQTTGARRQRACTHTLFAGSKEIAGLGIISAARMSGIVSSCECSAPKVKEIASPALYDDGAKASPADTGGIICGMGAALPASRAERCSATALATRS